MSAKGKQPAVQQPQSEAEIIQTFKAMRSELSRLASKMSELESEREEHRLVVESMEPLDGDRKCFRLINGVLVEQTVKTVVPTLRQNMDNIYNVMQRLADTFKQKEKDALEFQQKHNIRIESRK